MIQTKHRLGLRASTCLGAVVFGICLQAASANAGIVPIKLDCGTPTSPMQAGWTRITAANSFMDNKQVDLGNGITAGVGDDYGPSNTDRTTAGIMAGQGLDDLLRDFIQLSDSSANDRNKLFIKGLPDGTYDVTIYAFDSGWITETEKVNVNGTQYSIGPASGHSGNLDYVRVTVPVTLDSGPATNQIVIQRVQFGKINGVEIVPEPATLGLLALGSFGLAALRRRRK